MSEKQLSALIELLLRKDAEIAELKAEREKIVRCGECAFEKDCEKQITISRRDHVLEQNVYDYKRLGFCSFGQRKEAEE